MAKKLEKLEADSRVQAMSEYPYYGSVQNIDGAIGTYKATHGGKMPKSLSELVDDSGDEEPILRGGEGALVDPWGTEYKLMTKGKRYWVVSAGPDETFDTEDDIRSDKVESKKSK